MANKLFESLKGGQNPTATLQCLNTPSFWQQVDHMRRIVADPRAEVQRLIESGQMSQQEFEQMGRFASQMLGMRHK